MEIIQEKISRIRIRWHREGPEVTSIPKALAVEQEPSKDTKKVRGWRREKTRVEYQTKTKMCNILGFRKHNAK